MHVIGSDWGIVQFISVVFTKLYGLASSRFLSRRVDDIELNSAGKFCVARRATCRVLTDLPMPGHVAQCWNERMARKRSQEDKGYCRAAQSTELEYTGKRVDGTSTVHYKL